MRENNNSFILSLVDVCQAIDQGRLVASVSAGRWYVIRERDIAMLVGSPLTRARRGFKKSWTWPSFLN